MAESAHLEALKNAADKSFKDHRKAGEIAHAASAKAGMEAVEHLSLAEAAK